MAKEGAKYYGGGVVRYDACNQYYSIGYLDGDKEEFDEEDMSWYYKPLTLATTVYQLGCQIFAFTPSRTPNIPPYQAAAAAPTQMWLPALLVLWRQL